MSAVRSEPADEGRVAVLSLEAGKGNVITTAVARELTAALVAAQREPRVRAVVLAATGPHFSFGASVEEHLPAGAAQMLRALHETLRHLLASPVPVLAAVQGSCLGGGLEVALACTRIFAARNASLGQPEIRLGVFAPAASVLLPPRIGSAEAEGLLLSGRSVGAEEALTIGLVDELVEDATTPAAVAVAWASRSLSPLPRVAVQVALHAARGTRAEEAIAAIGRLEAYYLERVVPSAEATEGLSAFLERRAPRWQNG